MVKTSVLTPELKSELIKFIETEGRGFGGLEVRELELVFNGCQVSVWDDGKSSGNG